jgi:trehalose 6-phosphate phosphatase
VDLIDRLAEDPALAGLFFDVDGVLAPIVARPQDARVPDETGAELQRLNERYALVACISGRAGDEARRIVGVPELIYVGNHGLELDGEAAEWGERLQQFLAEAGWPATENKGLSASLHYRGAEDEDAARSTLEHVKLRAEQQGFVARFGRKVLEVLPPVGSNKGTAVRHLLDGAGLERVLVAGDDVTDLDAFLAVEELEHKVRVAVLADESPSLLADHAELVLTSTREFLELLGRL